MFKYAHLCFKSNLLRKYFAVLLSLEDSRSRPFSCTTMHTRFWEKKNHLNFQPIIHMTGEFFQFLSIQKVSPRAGMKHVGAVSCWALWKPHLFELHAQNGNSLGSTCEQQQQMHLRNSSSSEVHFLTYAKSVLHSPFSNLCLQHVQPLYCIFLPQYLSYRFWDWKG